MSSDLDRLSIGPPRLTIAIRRAFPPYYPDLRIQFRNYLEDRGLDPSLAWVNGWYPSAEAGDKEDRIVIPATSRHPAHGFWQARAMRPSVEPRYQSPHGARLDALVLVFPEGKDPRTGVVVEGPMDALAASEIGFLGISMMGATPSDAALDHLIDLSRRLSRVFVVPDNDSVSSAGYIMSALSLSANRETTEKILPLPRGVKDLAEMSYEQRRNFFRFDVPAMMLDPLRQGRG